MLASQVYELAPAAAKTALLPEQTVAEFTVIVGKGFTVTVTTATLEQPLALVPVTEYVTVVAGALFIVAVVAPLLHKYVVAPPAEKVALTPAHTTFGLTVVVTVGNDLILTEA